MSDEKVLADYQACDALLCEDESRDDFIAENIDRIEIWKKAAESGDAAGQLLYGLCFFYGHGEQEDEETGVQWFLKSAEQGNAQAQCSLGLCYQQGWGVEDDVEVANEWFAKAAVQGHEAACKELPLAVSIQLGIRPHKPLTKEIAEQFLADEDSVDLNEFTTIEDDAAEILGSYKDDIQLHGLTCISDSAAESLSNHEGELWLSGLSSLSDIAAKSLSKHQGELSLYGLTELSDEAAESLSKHRGELHLAGQPYIASENSIGIQFMSIPAGKFRMGIDRYKGCPGTVDGDWGPSHEVILTNAFDISRHPITQSQYEKVIGENPSHFKHGTESTIDDPTLPVENVTHRNAMDFCKHLSALQHERDGGYYYRLPTEAEWEYACRAGSQTLFYWGNNENGFDEFEWRSENSDLKTHPVGQKHANPWGLFDMLGNVEEWVGDIAAAFSGKVEINPQGAEAGQGSSNRVIRGGNFGSDTSGMYTSGYSAYKSSGDFGTSGSGLGFRVVRTKVKPDFINLDEIVASPPIGKLEAAFCPECKKQLRSPLAKQCFECGADWH